MEEAQRQLEEEKRALELERLRVFQSEKSSRAESGVLESEPEPEESPKRRRRRRKNRSPSYGRRDDQWHVKRRERPQVGRAPPPNFENVKSKVGSRENRHYKPHANKVKIYDDKEYMRKVKKLQNPDKKKKRRKSKEPVGRTEDDRPASLTMQRVNDDFNDYSDYPDSS